MNTIKVRNLEIGTGMPKICVPIVGKTVPEILENAKSAVQAKADVVEWRVDWYEDVFSFECVEHVLRKLCEITGEIPLLFTFRTLQEGGEQAIDAAAYRELNEKAARTKMADLIDAELSAGEKTVKSLIKTAHTFGVKVVVSNHDFEKTPSKEEIVARLQKMQELGADLPKTRSDAAVQERCADIACGNGRDGRNLCRSPHHHDVYGKRWSDQQTLWRSIWLCADFRGGRTNICAGAD